MRRGQVQWSRQERIDDRYVPEWRAYGKAVVERLEEELRDRGLVSLRPPIMPPLRDGLQGFVSQQYRVLMAWIPDWAPNPDAGHHVIRVDTMTEREAVK